MNESVEMASFCPWISALGYSLSHNKSLALLTSGTQNVTMDSRSLGLAALKTACVIGKYISLYLSNKMSTISGKRNHSI